MSGDILDNFILSKKSISLSSYLKFSIYSTLYTVYFALEMEIKQFLHIFHSALSHYQWNDSVAHCQPHGGGRGSDSTCK